MSDALNPSGPAQPTLEQGYETKGNPADTQPAEKATAEKNEQSNSGAKTTETRVPTKQTSYAKPLMRPPTRLTQSVSET